VEYFVVATDVDGAQTRKPEAPNSIFSIQILVTSEVRRDAQGNPMAPTAQRWCGLVHAAPGDDHHASGGTRKRRHASMVQP